MNADPDGRALAEVARVAFGQTGRPWPLFTVQEPEAHNDWNDQLRAAGNRVIELPCSLLSEL
jgi:hypothetical protein